MIPPDPDLAGKQSQLPDTQTYQFTTQRERERERESNILMV